jgi:hypothetical protein
MPVVGFDQSNSFFQRLSLRHKQKELSNLYLQQIDAKEKEEEKRWSEHNSVQKESQQESILS